MGCRQKCKGVNKEFSNGRRAVESVERAVPSETDEHVAARSMEAVTVSRSRDLDTRKTCPKHCTDFFTKCKEKVGLPNPHYLSPL